MDSCEQYNEIFQYLDIAQEQYGVAFRDGDILGMVETSIELTYAYTMLGNSALASKWACEFVRHFVKLVHERYS